MLNYCIELSGYHYNLVVDGRELLIVLLAALSIQ